MPVRIDSSEAVLPKAACIRERIRSVELALGPLVGINVQDSLSVTATIEPADAILETTTWLEVQAQLNETGTCWTTGRELFVVLEALLVRSLKFTVTAATVRRLGGRANFEAAVLEAGATLEQRSSSEYEVARMFDPPWRIFYKAELATVGRVNNCEIVSASRQPVSGPPLLER